QLVVAERLGRRQIQGARPRIRFQGRQYRQLVGPPRARRGTSAEHYVTAVAREIGGRELMRPGGRDTVINKRPHYIWVGPLRPGLWPAVPRWQGCDVAQRLLVGVRAGVAGRRRGAAAPRRDRCRRSHRRAVRGRNPTPDLTLPAS